MKTKIINMMLIFLLSISMMGCSDNKNPVPTNPSSSDSVLEAYKAVLQNKAEFFSTDSQKNLYLEDFLTNKEIYGTTFKVTHFSVLDMDGDKVPEVILELSVGDEPQFYEVLHDINGTVHGYLMVYRGLEELKEDGTFHFSNGAADNGWGKLKFQSKAAETDLLGYSQSSQNNGNLTIAYIIHNKEATKEAFDAFDKEQAGKKAVVWYEFSQQNVEAQLAAKK